MSESNPNGSETFTGYMLMWLTFVVVWILDANSVLNVTNQQFLMILAPMIIAGMLMVAVGLFMLTNIWRMSK